VGRLPAPTPHNVVTLRPIDKREQIYFDKFDDTDRFDKYDKLVSRRVADANCRGPPFFQKETMP
jgi:hypothetical protein